MADLSEVLAAAARKRLIASGGDAGALRAAVAACFREGTELGIALVDLVRELIEGPHCICRQAYFGDSQMRQMIEIVRNVRTDGKRFG